MNRLTRRATRLGLLTVGLAALFVGVNAVPAGASYPNDFVGTPLARGTNQSHVSLPLKTGLQIAVVKNTVPAHGQSGWHSHPGGAIVVVQAGEITTYVSAGEDEQEEGGGAGSATCIKTTYKAGEAFIERPGQPLNAVNTGLTVATVYATFPGLAAGQAPRTDEPDPGCRTV